MIMHFTGQAEFIADNSDFFYTTRNYCTQLGNIKTTRNYCTKLGIIVPTRNYCIELGIIVHN